MPTSKWRRQGTAWITNIADLKLQVEKTGQRKFVGKINGEVVIERETLNGCITATEYEAMVRSQ